MYLLGKIIRPHSLKESLKPPVCGRSERVPGSIHGNEKTAVDIEMRIVMITATGREISR